MGLDLVKTQQTRFFSHRTFYFSWTIHNA